MRRLLHILAGGLFFVVSFAFGWLAFVIGRNMIINLSLPASGPFLSYGLFGLEIKGWLMYGVPVLCGIFSVGLLAAGVSFILPWQNEK